MEQEHTTTAGTGLLQPPKLPLALHPDGPTTALSNAVERLRPCGEKTGTAELTSCLVLTAPTGMKEAERKAWLAVARQTLRGIPEDLLKYGCQKARETADHPAKIIPAIMAAVGQSWRQRIAQRSHMASEVERAMRASQQITDQSEAVPHEETQRILREVAEQLAVERGERNE